MSRKKKRRIARKAKWEPRNAGSKVKKLPKSKSLQKIGASTGSNHRGVFLQGSTWTYPRWNYTGLLDKF